jgi:hypothetical protein
MLPNGARVTKAKASPRLPVVLTPRTSGLLRSDVLTHLVACVHPLPLTQSPPHQPYAAFFIVLKAAVHHCDVAGAFHPELAHQ